MARTPKSLAAAIARDIPPHIRERGDKYVRQHRLVSLEWSENQIAYKVQGTDVYFVALSRDGEAIDFTCSCPYFFDRGPCKHVWAAAVAIDQDPRWDGSWPAARQRD